MNKKIQKLIIILVLLLILTACGNSENKKETKTESEVVEKDSAEETQEDLEKKERMNDAKEAVKIMGYLQQINTYMEELNEIRSNYLDLLTPDEFDDTWSQEFSRATIEFELALEGFEETYDLEKYPDILKEMYSLQKKQNNEYFKMLEVFSDLNNGNYNDEIYDEGLKHLQRATTYAELLNEESSRALEEAEEMENK